MTSDDDNPPAAKPPNGPTDVASRDASRRSTQLTELEALDQETPTQALKTLGILSIVAAVVLLIPWQPVSSAIAFGIGVSLLLWRHLRLRREERRG